MNKLYWRGLGIGILLMCSVNAIVLINAQEAQPQQQQPDTRDEPTLNQTIQQDIGAYLNTMKQIPDLVATLNNDQHALVVLLRSKVTWWETCVKDQACVDWARGK